MCLVVGGQAQPVTDQALGSWLWALPELSTSNRQLEDPLVLLTCSRGEVRQRLADLLGRLVWFPHGDMTFFAETSGPASRGAGVQVRVGLHDTQDGRGGRFGSVYPQGPAGDRVRWAYRTRFTSDPIDWLVERSAPPGSPAPAGLRPHPFGGNRTRGLCYFDRRDRQSRLSALNAPMLASSHVAWTPNDAYRPGTPAQPAPVTGARPWRGRELGGLPFGLDDTAVVVGYFAGGRFAVYDERQDVSYWEKPRAFGQRLRDDLAAAGGRARGLMPARVLLLTDFDAVPAMARWQIARALGGAELITVNTPATLFLDQNSGHGVPRARIALLPGNHAATTAPEWTSTTATGISTTLTSARGVPSAEKTPQTADLLPTSTPKEAGRRDQGPVSAQDDVSRSAARFDEGGWREQSDAVRDYARSSADFVAAVVELIQAHRQLNQARASMDGPGGSLSPQVHAAAKRRLAQAHDNLTTAETQFDMHSSRLVALGLTRLADEHELDATGNTWAMREADKLLGRAKIVIGTESESQRIRDVQQRVRELVAEQIRQGRTAEASATAHGSDLFTKSGLVGGALEVGGRNLTEEFRTQSRTIESDVHDAITERERSLAAEIAGAEENPAEVVDDAGHATRAQALHTRRIAAEQEIADMKRQAPAEILSRQRSHLVELIDGLKQQLTREQTGTVPGVRLLHQRELDEFNNNLTRIEIKLKKMIVEPTGHRGHHELLERSIGRHPDFGTKLSDAKYNNATEMARGLTGWVEAKENRHNEKLLAQKIFAEGQVEELIDVLLGRIWRQLPKLPNADLIRSELASGVSSFEPGRRLGLYVSYFRRATLPQHLEHLEATTWREPDHVLAVVREPTRFDLREKIMVLHDLTEYFGHAKYTPRTHGTGMLPDAPEHEIHSTTEVDARGYRAASSTDRGRNPVGHADGTIRNHQPTRNENAASTIRARERRIPVWGGASFTAVNMFKLTEWFGGSKYEIGAVAYGVFAFWRLHFDHTTWLAYHTLHEVLDIAQNFGLSYTMDDQTATLGTISTSAAVHEADFLATELRNGTLPELVGSTDVQTSDLRALSARLDAERRAAGEASTTSERLETYARLLSELEQVKSQVGLATTLGS